MNKELLKSILPHLICPACTNSEEALKIVDDDALTLECVACNNHYHSKNGVLCFIDFEKDKLQNIETKTDNYFGFEWANFNNWGFIPDDSITENTKMKYNGGLVSHRKAAFASKCRLTREDLQEGNIVLDAGCGNGRFTYEAATLGKAIVVGVDIGTGSTRAAALNNSSLDNVLIIQASLFNLPFKTNTFNAAFSNGVLMHTGNAQKAFAEVARTITPSGVFVAHVYHKLNPIWEMIDKSVRLVTTQLSIKNGMKFANFMAKLAAWANKKPGRLAKLNKFFRLQETEIHMFDWYSAPIATHHTYAELASWFEENNFTLLDTLPAPFPKFQEPWAANLKGKKNT